MTAASMTAQSARKPILYLGFETAALYWRAVREGRLPQPEPIDDARALTNCVHTWHELAQVDLSPLGLRLCHDRLVTSQDDTSLRPGNNTHAQQRQDTRRTPQGIGLPRRSEPLHMLVGTRTQRYSCHVLHPHLVLSQLPPRALYRVSDAISVTSPELTLVHLARTSETLPLLELACEWCGAYALRPSSAASILCRSPLTSIARIKDLAALPQAPLGATTLQKAASLIAEGLSSPRTTEVFLMLTLPAEMGGFELPRPQPNQQISLEHTPLAGSSARPCYTADLFWEDRRLIVACDDCDEHEGDVQQAHARAQHRSALAARGYHVIDITKRDVESLQAFERKLAQIALVLRLWIPTASLKTRGTRRALFDWLFDAGHDHLPLGCGYRKGRP